MRGHRRNLPLAELEKLPAPSDALILRACIVLRLAVTWHRLRSSEPLPNVSISASEGTLKLDYPKGWLDDHSLMRADLEQEAVYLGAVGVKLKVR